MDGTTSEQDKIRRLTLLISVMLLMISGGAYFLYEYTYQTKIQVNVTSKRVLPNTGAKKKSIDHSAQNVEKPQSIEETDRGNDVPITLELVSLNQPPAANENLLKTNHSMNSRPRIFRLSDEIEVLP
ncbi:hypothetical protein [Enterococcus sp. DIV0170]|jgi:hypothetical protein|uniref:hypothetical protein n=1 Tax=Enterococcus sp. DIV0170 TaxID=2774642 RepID=UPI003F27B137